jgi:hypothetical protein
VAVALVSGVAATLLLVWLADVKGAWRLAAGCGIVYAGLLFLATDADPEEDE